MKKIFALVIAGLFISTLVLAADEKPVVPVAQKPVAPVIQKTEAAKGEAKEAAKSAEKSTKKSVTPKKHGKKKQQAQ
jgi:hypothetical protein